MSQTLYVKNGSNKTAINPSTTASAVTMGNSNVETEITNVKSRVTTLEGKTTPTITEGTGITVASSETTVTISETYIDVCKVTSLDNVPSNLRDGGLIILEST